MSFALHHQELHKNWHTKSSQAMHACEALRACTQAISCPLVGDHKSFTHATLIGGICKQAAVLWQSYTGIACMWTLTGAVPKRAAVICTETRKKKSIKQNCTGIACMSKKTPGTEASSSFVTGGGNTQAGLTSLLCGWLLHLRPVLHCCSALRGRGAALC